MPRLEATITKNRRAVLLDIIDNENKNQPHSDRKLQQLLKDAGYAMLIEGVFQLRNLLNIPDAANRKRDIFSE